LHENRKTAEPVGALFSPAPRFETRFVADSHERNFGATQRRMLPFGELRLVE
jgi:hypothetical protein